MANKFIIFPEGKLAEAQAYKAACDAAFQLLSGEPEGVVGRLYTDAYGQHVTTYYGPPFTWDGINPVEETPDLLALRVDGVLHDDWVRPPEEEI